MTNVKTIKTLNEQGIQLTALKKDTKTPFITDWYGNPVQPEYFEQNPSYNVAVLTGEASGNLVDIDLDDPMAVDLAEYFLPKTGLTWGRTSKLKSHWLYKTTEASGATIQFQHGNLGTLVEFRGDKSCTMAPPSVHPSGELVEFSSDGAPLEIEKSVLLTATQKLAAATLLAHNWNEGNRHTLALAFSGVLLRNGWAHNEVINFLKPIVTIAGDEELNDRLNCVKETHRKLSDGSEVTGWPTVVDTIGDDVAGKISQWLNLSDVQSTPASLVPTLEDIMSGPDSHTDIGNGKRFAHFNSDKCFYHEGMGKWFNWAGNYWNDSSQTKVQKYAHVTVGKMFEESTDRYSIDWAKQSSSRQKLRSMVEESKVYISKSNDDLNSDPFLFNVKNKTINLRTGEALEHNQNDLIDQITNVSYDQDAKCPRFEAFLNEIFPDDIGLQDYVQKLLGYCLTGDTSEQKMFLFYGMGANGKGTLTELMRDIMGTYGVTIQADSLMQGSKQSGSQASPDIARLVNKRAGYISEGNMGNRLNEALVKQITGQDTLTARELHKSPFEFKPKFKMIFSTNYLPKVRGSDEGIWRRLVPVPFNKSFHGAQLDKSLSAKLSEEKSGILNWLIEGCLLWQNEGLIEPKAVLSAKKEYRDNSDNILRFLKDRTEEDEDSRVAKSVLYNAYKVWITSEGEHYTASSNEFGDILQRQGFVSHRTSSTRMWKGMKLLGGFG